MTLTWKTRAGFYGRTEVENRLVISVGIIGSGLHCKGPLSDPDPDQSIEECEECGEETLAVYIEDGICPDCRDD